MAQPEGEWLELLASQAARGVQRPCFQSERPSLSPKCLASIVRGGFPWRGVRHALGASVVGEDRSGLCHGPSAAMIPSVSVGPQVPGSYS